MTSEQEPGGSATLDAGRLVPAWFGEGLEFREASGIDYLWVKPGFDLDGKKLRFVPFGEVLFLGEKASKRKEDLRQRAAAVNPVLHEHLADRFRQVGARTSARPCGTERRVAQWRRTNATVATALRRGAGRRKRRHR